MIDENCIHCGKPKFLADANYYTCIACRHFEQDVIDRVVNALVYGKPSNPSGMICKACREVGALHCADPDNCGGMKPVGGAK